MLSRLPHSPFIGFLIHTGHLLKTIHRICVPLFFLALGGNFSLSFNSPSVFCNSWFAAHCFHCNLNLVIMFATTTAHHPRPPAQFNPSSSGSLQTAVVHNTTRNTRWNFWEYLLHGEGRLWPSPRTAFYFLANPNFSISGEYAKHHVGNWKSELRSSRAMWFYQWVWSDFIIRCLSNT